MHADCVCQTCTVLSARMQHGCFSKLAWKFTIGLIPRYLKEGCLQPSYPVIEPTSSLMSGRAHSALADLDSDVKDHPEPLPSASSRTTGHAANDFEDVCSCCSYYCGKDRLIHPFRSSERHSFNSMQRKHATASWRGKMRF